MRRQESPGTLSEMNTRVARTHAAVMDAAIELLLEGGPDALTVDGVVARSGVAKSTVYRHWATRDDLVADVFEHLAPQLDPPDPSLDFDESLRTLVQRLADILADDHWRRVLPALMMLKMHHGDVAQIEERISSEQIDVCGDVLRRGMAEGRIAADADVQTLLALLTGPLLMAGLTSVVPIDKVFVDRVVDHFLAGARPRTTD
ncbi:MAG: regulatory protein TetR [Ilumatobacteraceae bacterium]|nr:regulatory protein TetR [Ilumatobacteraceae bacterium]